MVMREQGVGQFPEELFQQAGNAVDIVEEVLGVAEIDLARICYILP